MNKFAIIFAAAVLAYSCSREADVEIFRPGETITFTAGWAESEDTRTILQSDGTSVWWEPNAQVNLFFSDKASGKFTSTNSQPQAIVDFQGSLPIVVGSIETENPAHAYWAVYPYDSANTCDGESVTLSIPSIQTAVEGSFANKMFPSIAKSTNFYLAFYNVCGGVRFSVANEGISSITFKANNGESLAGKVRVGFDSVPVVKSVLEGVSEVVVNAPDGGFDPRMFYFATFLPQTMSKGVSLVFKKEDGKVASTSLDNSISINRSRFGKLDEKDKGLEFKDEGGSVIPNPNDIIVFADERIKNHCVAAYDTNSDGEISYGEAAAATSVEGVFTSTLYTSFNEFKYFTGITEIPAGWFKGRGRLTSIALPEGLVSIGYSSFEDCNGLIDIYFPSTLTTIGRNAFGNCTVLKNVHIPSLHLWLTVEFQDRNSYPLMANVNNEGHLFIGEEELTDIVLPEGLESIREIQFCKCSGLTTISFPTGLTRVGSDAFSGCANLKKVLIPSIEDWLQIRFDSIGSAPFYDSGNGHLFIDENEISSIVIPAGIKTINRYAFCGCVGVTSVSLPEELTNVGGYAFGGCSNLTHVFVRSLADWMEISFADKFAAPFNSSREGHLFIANTEVTQIVIPEETNFINAYAFYNCTGLKRIDMEPTVPPELGYSALDNTRCPVYVWKECYTAYVNKWFYYSNILCISGEGIFEEPELVDMGLSVKWASFNLGANKPEDYGRMFSWGETELKDTFIWNTYHHALGTGYSLTKYCTNANYGYNGFVDNITTLDLEDDAAHVLLGKKWRIPTKTEIQDLITNCSSEWITLNGVSGYRLTSRITNNRIFLPAAGYYKDDGLVSSGGLGAYWSSTLYTKPLGAYTITLQSGSISYNSYQHKYMGCSIRPVYAE